MGKFMTASVWHKAEQIICKSIWPLVMLGWMTTFVCTPVYLCRIYIHTHTHLDLSLWMKSVFQTHLDTYMCKFMNTNWFSRLTISRRPQAGGMYWLSHLFSYEWGVHCWFWVCSSAALSFIRKYFSQQISIKRTQTWHMYSFMAQASYH